MVLVEEIFGGAEMVEWMGMVVMAGTRWAVTVVVVNPEVAWRSWKRGRLRRTRVKSLRPEIAVRFPLSTFRMARCNDAIPERDCAELANSAT